VFGFTLVALQRASAQEAEPRLALVIGNADYASQPLATAANDAGLMAQTLQLAGFDVTAAADLDQVRLRQAVQGFVEDARRAGPGAKTISCRSMRASRAIPTRRAKPCVSRI
jgi:hypothetical protein